MTPAAHRYLTARNAAQMRRDRVADVFNRRYLVAATLACAVVAWVF